MKIQKNKVITMGAIAGYCALSTVSCQSGGTTFMMQDDKKEQILSTSSSELASVSQAMSVLSVEEGPMDLTRFKKTINFFKGECWEDLSKIKDLIAQEIRSRSENFIHKVESIEDPSEMESHFEKMKEALWIYMSGKVELLDSCRARFAMELCYAYHRFRDKVPSSAETIEQLIIAMDQRLLEEVKNWPEELDNVAVRELSRCQALAREKGVDTLANSNLKGKKDVKKVFVKQAEYFLQEDVLQDKLKHLTVDEIQSALDQIEILGKNRSASTHEAIEHMVG